MELEYYLRRVLSGNADRNPLYRARLRLYEIAYPGKEITSTLRAECEKHVAIYHWRSLPVLEFLFRTRPLITHGHNLKAVLQHNLPDPTKLGRHIDAYTLCVMLRTQWCDAALAYLEAEDFTYNGRQAAIVIGLQDALRPCWDTHLRGWEFSINNRKIIVNPKLQGLDITRLTVTYLRRYDRYVASVWTTKLFRQYRDGAPLVSWSRLNEPESMTLVDWLLMLDTPASYVSRRAAMMTTSYPRVAVRVYTTPFVMRITCQNAAVALALQTKSWEPSVRLDDVMGHDDLDLLWAANAIMDDTTGNEHINGQRHLRRQLVADLFGYPLRMYFCPKVGPLQIFASLDTEMRNALLGRAFVAI